MNVNKARNPGMDIIRTIAVLFVFSVHFFMHTEFYTVNIEGSKIYIMTLLRTLFMICVPLFMMLTGYLNINKKVSVKYYGRIIKVLGIYLLASCACTLYSVLVLHKEVSFLSFIKSIFDYSAAPYSWYVEMYIGLFLLCPFLNLMYNGLENKKHKQLLILTFVFLTSLSSILNSIPFSENISNAKIIPDYWIQIYPITYYFIGCYIREQKPKIKKRYTLICMLLVFVLNGSYSYIRSYGNLFQSGAWQNYFGLGQIIMATLFFLLFTNISYKKFPQRLSFIFGKISNLSFGAYLVSWVFDDFFYSRLCTNVIGTEARFNYFIPVVFSVFICSHALSFVLEIIYNALAPCGRKLFLKEKDDTSDKTRKI